VPIKAAQQQGVMALHCIREGFKQERTACINRIRGVLTEFGLVFGKSPKVLRALLPDALEDADNELSGFPCSNCGSGCLSCVLAGVATALCARPVLLSTPTCSFMPKCHCWPFLV
jgi:hypothetical protein